MAPPQPIYAFKYICDAAAKIFKAVAGGVDGLGEGCPAAGPRRICAGV